MLGLDALDKLVRCEHDRWNAYHILNGWKNGSCNGKKDKNKKLHPCLTTWKQLEEVSKNKINNHDFYGDDVETIIRSYQLLDIRNKNKLSNETPAQKEMDEFFAKINKSI